MIKTLVKITEKITVKITVKNWFLRGSQKFFFVGWMDKKNFGRVPPKIFWAGVPKKTFLGWVPHFWVGPSFFFWGGGPKKIVFKGGT